MTEKRDTLRGALRVLIAKWRKEWEGGDEMTRADGSKYIAGGDKDDYYAGQYSRAEQHADELEAAIGLPAESHAPPPGEVEALRAEVERLRERLRAARRAALAGASQYDALAANARATDNDATAPMLQRAAERFRDVLDALDRPTPGDNRG